MADAQRVVPKPRVKATASKPNVGAFAASAPPRSPRPEAVPESVGAML